jgi:type IV secretory pathway protease TraF
MRRLLLTGLILLALAALASPRRHEVVGFSMAPDLRPGDIVSPGWLPQADRLTGPQRFDRWLLAGPDATPIIKRIVGLPGETVRIVDGDLMIDDEALLTPPPVLAQVASVVAPCESRPGVWQRSFSCERVYDDADFAPEESRRLFPVRDIGIAVVIDAPQASPVTVAIRVGGRAIRWHLPAGRFAVVAGRLDGHLVATAWTLAGPPAATSRSALPPDPPAAWQIAEPWAELSGDEEPMPVLGLSLADASGPLDAVAVDRHVARCLVWRDVLHRLPPDGRARWEVGPGEVFVVGDFPSGSRDSRHWGPLPTPTLQHRLEVNKTNTSR